MAGTYSGAGLDLTPDYWLSQPPGYSMVGLNAGAARQRRLDTQWQCFVSGVHYVHGNKIEHGRLITLVCGR